MHQLYTSKIRRANLKNLASKILIGALVLVSAFIAPTGTRAAQVTSFSDTLSRLKASTAANHTIYLVSPGGIASGQTVTLTFGAAFTTSSIVLGDIDFATGNSGTCSSASYTDQTLVASGATSSQWNTTFSSSVLTITSGGASATSAAGNCMRFLIGTNASGGTNQITNGSAGASTATVVANVNAGTDTGTLFIPIITNDQVTISATVDPTISFSISSTSVTFGSLSASTGRWATGSGANASAATDPTTSNTAHTLTVGTNASTGYTVTYIGALPTSGANTIAAATITGDSDGTPGTNQFALCGKGTSGSPSVVSTYLCATNSNYNFAAGTTTTLFTASAPASSDVVSVAYLANIASSKQAGTYTTTLTYVATGNF